MQQHVPDRPDYIPANEWQYILERDRHSCACAAYECKQAGNTDYCCPELEHDHRQPREWRGDNSFANIRLLCKTGSSFSNRLRLNVPLSDWVDKNIWDDSVHAELLRQVQRLAAYDEIVRLAAMIKANDEDPAREPFRNRLLRAITFIPGTTGIGKTILMQTAFYAFNAAIGRNYPRVKHVLWFEPETGLRDSIKDELLKDAKDLGVIDHPPIVYIAKGFDDLLKGPNGADVTVACPQSLWKMEKSNHVRSDNDKRRVLEQWDTGVFDEVDWADHQNQHIAALWTNAVKFSISAVCPF